MMGNGNGGEGGINHRLLKYKYDFSRWASAVEMDGMAVMQGF